MPGTKGVEAVDKALTILACFDFETQEISLANLARKTGFYKSTALRLATSLENFGYLVRNETGRYRLGPTAWRIGACYRQAFDLGEIIRPELRSLRDETSETASFYIREGDTRVCLFREEPDRAIRHAVLEGRRMQLDRGATGRILLAYSEPESNDGAEVREKGYAVSLGERDPEVAAVSMPVTTNSGRLVGAISVSGLITRFDTSRHEQLIAALKKSQTRLSERISS